MLRFALRNLLQSPARLVMSVGGVALAFMLVLSLDAIFLGIERQLGAYIEGSGADVFVAQSGVRNMHMASSSLGRAVVDRVAAVDGVAEAAPLAYVSTAVVQDDRQYLGYVIGLPRGARLGRPASAAEGRADVGPGEVVIDGRVADAISVGEDVTILGRSFRVVGVSRGYGSVFNSFAFVPLEAFAAYGSDAVSYVLVRAAPGTDAAALAARIEAEVPDVTATLRGEFARQEIRVIADMATDVILIMNTIGFVIGLAVMALTVYTATLARRAEYGVLKALGARTARLCRAVIAQAVATVALGLLAGIAFTLAVAWIVPRTDVQLSLALDAAAVVKAAVFAVAITALAAVLPILRIARIDPAVVFRRRIA
ncbi:MAG TPA: ABC transporter permease [Candidatus Limnocylindria bacterium]|nr:ABC transporter permease [Candidatus Limnocylindria bacterium]